MQQDCLDKLITELLLIDRLSCIRVPQISSPALIDFPAVREWFIEDEPASKSRFEFREREEKLLLEAVSAAFEPAVVYDIPATVRYEHNVQYSLSQTALSPSFYVHVPSWVRVHRAPFHTFGPNLFGLAYTSTGDVHVRDDLEGNEFAEVLQHEVFHQLYPNCSEQQVRQFTLARFGEHAAIHHRIGPG